MTRWSRLLAPGIALGLGSCAHPARMPETPVTQPKPAPEKPLRMNARGKVTSISLSDFFVLHETGKVLLFDARPAFFYNLGHIPGALNLPKTNCDAEIARRKAEIAAAVAAGKTIVVYCTNMLCPDARTVAIHLAAAGYSSSVLTGGWDSYKETGLPTE